jgi:hypothetical protein
MTTTGPEPPASDATATRAALRAPSDNPVPAAGDEAIAIAVERAAGPLLPWERIAAALRRDMLSGALPPGARLDPRGITARFGNFGLVRHARPGPPLRPGSRRCRPRRYPAAGTGTAAGLLPAHRRWRVA